MEPTTSRTRGTRDGVRALAALTGSFQTLNGNFLVDLPEDHDPVVGVLAGPGGSLVEIAGSSRPKGTRLRSTELTPVERALTVFRPGSLWRQRFHGLGSIERGRAYELLTLPDGSTNSQRTQVAAQVSSRSQPGPVVVIEVLLAPLMAMLALVGALLMFLATTQAAVSMMRDWSTMQDWSTVLGNVGLGVGAVGASVGARAGVNRLRQRQCHLVQAWLTDDWVRVPVTDRRYRLVRELLLVAARIERPADDRESADPFPSFLADIYARVQALAWFVASGPDLSSAQLTDGLSQASRVREQVAAVMNQAEQLAAAIGVEDAGSAAVGQAPLTPPAPTPPPSLKPSSEPSPVDDLWAVVDLLSSYMAAMDEVATADRIGRAAALRPR